MRLLHTSDWHLGRTLHGVDLLTHQAAFLDHLVEVTRAERIDAVLLAGDVYDRAIPPVDAVTLLSDTIVRLAEHAQVVVTPGNHDSAARLGFGADLLREAVHIRAQVAACARPVLLAREGEDPVAVYALPYLDPDGARHVLAPGAEPLPRSHQAVMAAAMEQVGEDLASRRAAGARLRAVVMGHAFVTGGQPSESERDIRVGGVDAVSAGVFAGHGLDYVALGHLHGPQRVTVPSEPTMTDGTARDVDLDAAGVPRGTGGPATRARYSGSPLAYSFSERQQTKSSVVVDLDRGKLELLPCPVPRRLAEVSGSLADLLGASGEAHVGDWLRVIVTDERRPTELYSRVKGRFPHALQVLHQPPARTERGVVAVRQGADPLVVAAQFVEYVSGKPPTAAEEDVLRAALEAANAAGASA